MRRGCILAYISKTQTWENVQFFYDLTLDYNKFSQYFGGKKNLKCIPIHCNSHFKYPFYGCISHKYLDILLEIFFFRN